MPRTIAIGCLLFILGCSPRSQVLQSMEASVEDFNSDRASGVAIMLRWTPIKENIIGYTLYRHTSNGFTKIASLNSGETRFLDTGLDPNQNAYHYTLEIHTGCQHTEKLQLTQEAVVYDEPPLYKYHVDLPSHYNPETDQLHPLVIFLHGAGERGNDLSKVRVHGPPMLQDKGQEFPAIIASPLCPKDVYWNVAQLEVFYKDIMKKYNIDHSRVYLTGLSMGGYFTWTWGTTHPEHFAALVPICGGGNPAEAINIKDIPVWAFHGGQDDVVPITQSQEMIQALQDLGAHPKFTIYPEAGHDSWTEAYNTAELWEWIFSQSK